MSVLVVIQAAGHTPPSVLLVGGRHPSHGGDPGVALRELTGFRTNSTPARLDLPGRTAHVALLPGEYLAGDGGDARWVPLDSMGRDEALVAALVAAGLRSGRPSQVERVGDDAENTEK